MSSIQAYALSLAALLLYVPLVRAAPVSFHATLASLGIVGAFSYRDVYPLVTFIHDPADASEGWLVWTKLALAGVAGILVPMLEPHMYVPYDATVSLAITAFSRELTIPHTEPPKEGKPGADHLPIWVPQLQLHHAHHHASSECGSSEF